jgi:organic radical activating enzyme
MLPKRNVDYIEFYITNVCNLTCENCNRFNNHTFKGWQKWDDYHLVYKQWAEYLDLTKIVILGGEPLLNPDIVKWATGITQLWPDAGVGILTNGFRINQTPGLYECLRQTNVYLDITVHNTDTQNILLGEISKFLKGKITYESDSILRDSNGVKVLTAVNDEFTTSSVIKQSPTSFTLHQTPPEEAFDVCTFAKNLNLHMIKGSLYKCGPVALFPEFDHQFDLQLSADDKKLIHSYEPLTVDSYSLKSDDFFESLKFPIPQCKFCPEKYHFQKIYPVLKGKE